VALRRVLQFLLVFLVAGCNSGGHGDSETHWLSCKVDADCPGGDRCEAKRCVPPADAGGSPDAGSAPDASLVEGGAHAADATGPVTISDLDAAVPLVDACSRDDGRITVLAHVPNAHLLAADADFVYFDDAPCGPLSGHGICAPVGGPIRRVPRCGGAVQMMDPGPDLVATLLDGGNVLYAVRRQDPTDGAVTVVRIDKATSASKQLPLPAPVAPGLAPLVAATSTRLVYYDPVAGEIRTLSVGSDGPDPWSVAAPGNVTMLATNETTAYWSDGSSVFRAQLGITTQAESFSNAPDPVQYLAAAGDRAYVYTYGSPSGPLGELLSTGPLTAVGALPNAPIAFEDGSIYYSLVSDAAGSAIMRVKASDLTAPELTLRYEDKAVVNGGWLFWLHDGYLLTRKAVPEPSPDPVLPADGPTWVRSFDATSLRHVAARPGGGYVISGNDSSGNTGSGPPGGGTVLDESFVSIYADRDTLVKKSILPTANVYEPLGIDATGNVLVPASAGGQALGWILLDPSGNQIGGGALGMTYPGTSTIGSSGMLVAAGKSLSGAMSTKAFASDGTPLWTTELPSSLVPQAVTPVLSLAVTSADRVLVGAGTDAGTLPPSGALASVTKAGVIEWTKSFEGVSVTHVAARADGDVVIAGFAEFYFDLGAGQQLVAAPGRTNVVLAELDPAGNVRWEQSFEGTSDVALALDGQGAPVLAAQLPKGGFADLGAPAIHGARTASSFVARFDASGAPTSVRTWTDPASSPPSSDAGAVASGALSSPVPITDVAIVTTSTPLLATGTALVTSSAGAMALFAP